MIKPHTAAKQETKLLGIRGEEKANKKERVTREMREERGRGKEEHRREKPFWWLLSSHPCA